MEVLATNNGRCRIVVGDCLEGLRTLPGESVNCCVTSPPYWGLRDYGHDGQIGLEETPEQYVSKMVEVFREVRRVLRDDGTLWLNLGDSYNGIGGPGKQDGGPIGKTAAVAIEGTKGRRISTLKPKDLVGIPWSVAKALQAPFYAGRIKSEVDRVWLAATIDAEGSICGFTHKRKDDGTIRTGVHLTITNTNRPLLDNAFRIWPTSREDHNCHGKGHFGTAYTYRWIAHNVDDKAALLCEIYPYLIAKKKQAMLAWNFFEMSREAKRLARTGEAESVKERRAWIVAAVSRLNHFENVDVPSWCREPPPMFEPGYYLRQDIVWAKPNPLPESVTDRCTKAHEYVFLLTKSAKYWYDAEAVSEAANTNWLSRGGSLLNETGWHESARGRDTTRRVDRSNCRESRRNRRSVWTIATKPYSGAHFAVMPPALVEPCILAGCPEDGVVLDPFLGSGTVAEVALRHGRRAVGCELNPQYVELIKQRVHAELDRTALVDGRQRLAAK